MCFEDGDIRFDSNGGQPRDKNGQFCETGGSSAASELPNKHANKTRHQNSTTTPEGGNMGLSNPQGKAGDNIVESGENINENTKSAAEQAIEVARAEVGTLDNPSAYGSNPYLSGFTSGNLDEHWENHKNQYRGLTKEQYAQRAHNLVCSATSDNILGYRAKNGSIARYNKTTHDFVQGFDTGVATMFPLKGGEARFNKKKQRAEV